MLPRSIVTVVAGLRDADGAAEGPVSLHPVARMDESTAAAVAEPFTRSQSESRTRRH